jgi:hypothetical protein
VDVQVAFDQPGLRDLHQQLAELLALEQAIEHGRRVPARLQAGLRGHRVEAIERAIRRCPRPVCGTILT